MRKSKCIAPLLALALVAAACGGDDDDDAGGTDAPVATDAPSTAGPTDTEPTDPEPTDTEPTDTEPTDTEPVDDTEPSDSTEPDGTQPGGEMCTEDCEPITVGMLADLSGAFAPLVQEVVAAQEVYWEMVNRDGGIDGHPIELLVEDTGYDVARTQEVYEGMRGEVDIISQATGSPHTASIAEALVEDHVVAIPLSWYSGWAFDEANGTPYGLNAYESYTNYCIESMNAIEWLSENRDVQDIAIVSFPGEYGQDGAAGAKYVAEQLGLNVVFDGEGLVTPPSADNPSPDQSAVISEIVASGADLVWATVNPATLGAIMGGAAAQGFTGLWSGNSPTYSFKMLDVPQIAPILDEYYIVSTYISVYGADVPGMTELVEEMTAARPDLTVSDVYVLGWTEAMITEAILRLASANGDLTPEGIEAAAREVEVDFEGLAPNQTWVGEPNDFVVRESYIYDVDLASYNPITLGEGVGSTGTILLEGPYTSDTAAEFEFTEPCFVG